MEDMFNSPESIPPLVGGHSHELGTHTVGGRSAGQASAAVHSLEGRGDKPHRVG